MESHGLHGVHGRLLYRPLCESRAAYVTSPLSEIHARYGEGRRPGPTANDLMNTRDDGSAMQPGFLPVGACGVTPLACDNGRAGSPPPPKERAEFAPPVANTTPAFSSSCRCRGEGPR